MSDISLLPPEWQNIGLGAIIDPISETRLGVENHNCSSALFEYRTGSVVLGEGRLNNNFSPLTGAQTASGTYICGDYNNTPSPLTGGVWAGTPTSRYSKITISATQAAQIANQSGTNTITINTYCAKSLYSCCSSPAGCNCCSLFNGGCHTNAIFVRITKSDGTLVYAGPAQTDTPVVI